MKLSKNFLNVIKRKTARPWITNYPRSGGPPPYIGCVSSSATPLFHLRIFKEKPPDSDDESSSCRRPSTLSFACNVHAVYCSRST